jgi:hypothetical protein
MWWSYGVGVSQVFWTPIGGFRAVGVKFFFAFGACLFYHGKRTKTNRKCIAATSPVAGDVVAGPLGSGRCSCAIGGPSLFPFFPRAHGPPTICGLPDARALNIRATAMEHRGEFASALPLQEQVLMLSQTAHAASPSPKTILDVVFAMWHLGSTKRDLGDLPAGHAMLLQAVALAEQPPVGPVHPRLAQALRDLGRVLYLRGRYDEADVTLQRTLTMQEQMLGPNHDNVSVTLTCMG